MKGSTKLFRLFGIDIQLHFSWWFVFVLISWSLSSAFFPQYFPGYSKALYWVMGILSALLLFISVLLHELSHSLVARAKHIKVESITFFFFGGVAGITTEDMKPSAEFQMAIAGPLFSLLLAGIFLLVHKLDVNFLITAISFYLYQLNFILALFNLVPGYPLDGGRAFRAILYAYLKDIQKATKIAAGVGKFVAALLILLGVLSLFASSGNGLWFIILGAFLYFLAGASYQQVVIKEILRKVSIPLIMKRKIPTVPASQTFAAFLKTHLKSQEDVFLVSDKKYQGIIDVNSIQPLPEKMQQLTRLSQLATPLSQIKSVSLRDTAYTAFQLLGEQGLTFLPVMEKGKIVGFVTRQAVMHHLVWNLRYGIGEHRLAREIIKRHKK